MNYLLTILFAVLLASCGGGEKTATRSSLPQTVRPAALANSDNETPLHLYQALYGKAPSFSQLETFKSQITAIGSVGWANQTASSFNNLSTSEFAAKVLNNISITPTTLTPTAQFGSALQAFNGLLDAFVQYLNLVGASNRGVVAMQLTKIISNLEVDTQFGVYGAAAVALNKQIVANSVYSLNPNSVSDSVVAVGPTLSCTSNVAFTTLAGKPGAMVNSVDGTGTAAQFSAPRGITVDAAGNLYVADASNHTIRKVSSSGVVTTLAGVAGSAGTTADTPAKFHEPFGVAVDSAGTIYVSDTNNNAIRKITPAGVVTTLAGGAGPGYADATGTAAKFKEPHGIAVDAAGNVYVADYENHVVRKVTPTGVVTTLAGTANATGTTDGQGAAARFMALQGLTVDGTGNVYVADGGSRSIRKITPSGLVSTVIGGSSNPVFGSPRGLTIDATASALYVTDFSAHIVMKVTLPGGVVSTVAGTAPTAGSTDGTPTSALFNAPSSIAMDSANNLYVADTANNTIRKISSLGSVSTLAGLAGRSNSVDGKGDAARFEEPYAVATDGTYVYVADHTDHTIRKVSRDGTVTTLAGKAGTFGSTDGTGTAARFNTLTGIAADSFGTVYVADSGNATVRKITATGVVTTLAGKAGTKGSTDATGTAARFAAPSGIAVDSAGNVFVVDSEASTVRKITPGGVVSTVAGSANSNGFINGPGATARFAVPFDVAVDLMGNLYITDRNNSAIRKVSSGGDVTTLAGSGKAGFTNGIGAAASFTFPSGIAVDSAGVVYAADTDNQVIRKITPNGEVTTLAGGSIGSTDGVGTAAKFWNPKDVAVDAKGTMFVTDRGNYTIRMGSPQLVPPVGSSEGCRLN